MGQMFADILGIKMFETSEAFGMEENQNGYNLGIGQSAGLVSMDFTITELMFFKF